MLLCYFQGKNPVVCSVVLLVSRGNIILKVPELKTYSEDDIANIPVLITAKGKSQRTINGATYVDNVHDLVGVENVDITFTAYV